jgi:hypothetical protein
MVTISKLEPAKLSEAGGSRASHFSDSERSRSLKDLSGAILSRDKEKAITEAELALMVWG